MHAVTHPGRRGQSGVRDPATTADVTGRPAHAPCGACVSSPWDATVPKAAVAEARHVYLLRKWRVCMLSRTWAAEGSPEGVTQQPQQT